VWLFVNSVCRNPAPFCFLDVFQVFKYGGRDVAKRPPLTRTRLSYDSVVCFCWKYPTHNILLPFYSFFLDIRAKVKIQKQKQCCEITQRNSEPCRTKNTAPLPSIEDRGQTVRITTSTRAGLHRCRSTPHASPRLLTMETYYCGQRSIAIGRRSRYSWNDHNLAMTCDLDL